MSEQTAVDTRPSPLRWVTRLDGPGGTHGPVPVQRPDDPARAAAWARVLAERFDPAGGPVPAERLVVCWEDRALPAAAVYRDRCAGELTVRADLAGVLAAVAAWPGRPVVVVAFADRLTVAALTRIGAAAAAAGAPLGFLYGRDEAGLSFAVAKAVLPPAAGLSGVDVYDAPAHRAADNARRLPADVAGGLRRPALVKVIRSHGEGGHAKLGDTVVCGLPGGAEFPSAPDQGCTSAPRSCKRAAPLGATVVYGGEVAAPVVFFVCCNGFNVAGELFPSPVSLAVALAEGSAGAVIAPVRPLVAPDDLFAALRAMIAEGGPLGAIVARLNELCARLDQPGAFVLHGDPCQVLPATRAPAGPPAADEPPESLEPLRDWLVQVSRHTGRAGRLLRSARAWLDDRATDLVDPLSAQLDRVERLALNALKWAEGAPGGESRARLLRTATLLRTAVATWDRAAGRLLLQARDAIDAYDLGHYDQVLTAVEPGGPCARCGTPTERHRFGRGEEPDQERIGVLCLVCGPVREHRAAGPALTVTVHGGGDRLRLRAELTVPARPLLHGVQLYLRFFDKALDRCVHEEARTVPAADQVVEFAVDLPPELSVDLHSVRLVATSGLDVAYARARFAHLPGQVRP